MKYVPNRKSPRLKDYDYSQAGLYFVTICTYHRTHLFGHNADGIISSGAVGEIAATAWLSLPEHHPGIELDAFVVMPNHIHGIIVLVGTTPASSANTPSANAKSDAAKSDKAGLVPTGAPSGSLGSVIGSYKSGATRRIREALNDPLLNVWQTRYHDRIIRSEVSLRAIQEYVLNNRARWQEDTFFTP